jgi:hypothetical protein
MNKTNNEKNQKRVYLAGKMTGIENLNYPAFTAAAAELRAKNYFVFSPHENDARYNIDPSKPISRDIRKKLILDDLTFILAGGCDEVWVLPNWRGSLGVAAEIATARSCHIPVKFIRANKRGANEHATKEKERRRSNSGNLFPTPISDRLRERSRV